MNNINMTKIFSILNITPDSFSDGGRFANEQEIEAEVYRMLESSIDVIDVGAVATNPYVVKSVDTDTEMKRIENILPKIVYLAKSYRKFVSLDSYNYDIIKYGIDCGVDIINDQSAAKDYRIAELISKKSHMISKYIFMHSVSLPVRSDSNVVIEEGSNIIDYLLNWATEKQNKFIKTGIPSEKLIFDPGLGFGKNNQQCLEILSNINVFHEAGLQVMIGHSRKRFLKEYSNDAVDLDALTLLVSSMLMRHNIYAIRVHNYAIHSFLKENLNIVQ